VGPIWRVVGLFIEAASPTNPANGEPYLAVMPEIGRNDCRFTSAWQEFHDVVHKCCVDAFEPAIGEELVDYLLLYSGVFALRAEAPHWRVWGTRSRPRSSSRRARWPSRPRSTVWCIAKSCVRPSCPAGATGSIITRRHSGMRTAARSPSRSYPFDRSASCIA